MYPINVSLETVSTTNPFVFLLNKLKKRKKHEKRWRMYKKRYIQRYMCTFIEYQEFYFMSESIQTLWELSVCGIDTCLTSTVWRDSKKTCELISKDPCRTEERTGRSSVYLVESRIEEEILILIELVSRAVHPSWVIIDLWYNYLFTYYGFERWL